MSVVLAAFDNGTRSATRFHQTRDGGASWRRVIHPRRSRMGVGNADRCAAFKSRCTDTIRLYATADGGRHRTRILSRAEPIEQQPPLGATKPTQSPSFRALTE